MVVPATGCGPRPSEVASELARDLAEVLGEGVGWDHRPGPGDDDHSCTLAAWARSGLMALTGTKDGPPLPPPGPVPARLQGAALLLAAVAEGSGRPLRCGVPDVAELTAGRAALAGYRRRGRQSAGGSCRLLATADGWIAVNLARRADVEAVPAILGEEVDGPLWEALERGAEARHGAELVERAQLLGVPAAVVPDRPPAGARPWLWRRGGDSRRLAGRRLRVVDLSAMWAGPLCAHLLGLAGAQVIKVESADRPDGARRGVPGFYRWLHAGHDSLVLPFRTPEGRRALREAVAGADVVIEASRPRALLQLGVDAEELLAARPGMSWISITGYGRAGPWSNRVAFGDDAAAAGGLVARDDDGPVFCGDALADPVTGLVAALAATASVAAGGGWLVDVCLRDAAAWVAAPVTGPPATGDNAGKSCGAVHRVEHGPEGWVLVHDAPGRPVAVPVLAPRPPALIPWPHAADRC